MKQENGEFGTETKPPQFEFLALCQVNYLSGHSVYTSVKNLNTIFVSQDNCEDPKRRSTKEHFINCDI